MAEPVTLSDISTGGHVAAPQTTPRLELLGDGVSPRAFSFVLGQKHARSSVTYAIHNTLNDAKAEMEQEIDQQVDFLQAVREVNSDELGLDDDDESRDDISEELERLDSAEEELQNDLFAAEREWNQLASLEQTLFAKHQQHSNMPEEKEEEKEEFAYPNDEKDRETRPRHREQDEKKEAEEDQTSFTTDSDSETETSPQTFVESNAVEMEALSATGLGVSLGMAADALVSRMYQDVSESTRILPAYLQRQLHVMTSVPDIVMSSETTNSILSQASILSAPNLWKVGIPLLGSASSTGKMMLFSNRLVEESDDEID